LLDEERLVPGPLTQLATMCCSIGHLSASGRENTRSYPQNGRPWELGCCTWVEGRETWIQGFLERWRTRNVVLKCDCSDTCTTPLFPFPKGVSPPNLPFMWLSTPADRAGPTQRQMAFSVYLLNYSPPLRVFLPWHCRTLGSSSSSTFWSLHRLHRGWEKGCFIFSASLAMQ
jgi:hypothetical protein